MKRAINFGAGPSAIPYEVLKEAQRDLLDFNAEGLSIMEVSHRSDMYSEIHIEAISLIKELYKVPDDYEVIFMQGGASFQFAMVPMNLYRCGRVQFVNTGTWASKAIREAMIQQVRCDIVADSKESNYDHIPKNIEFDDNADYVYIASNNTIYGTQFREFPITKAPLVVDASSDIFSYEVDWSRVDMIFAGAQKNAGLSGVTIAIIKKELIDSSPKDLPSMLQYRTYSQNNSLYNTPPTFGIYIVCLTMRWLKSKGGIKEIQKLNKQKADILYNYIDKSDGFYIGHAQKDSRSLMNVTFNIKNRELEAKLIEEATKARMIGLKGHRSVGGLRASIYNAMSKEGVEKLVDLMKRFAKENSLKS